MEVAVWLLLIVVLLLMYCNSKPMGTKPISGGMYGPGGTQRQSNFMAYTIQGGDPFSDGIVTTGGTFTNTSNLF